MERPTDQDMTAIEKIICNIHRSQEKRACDSMAWVWGISTCGKH